MAAITTQNARKKLAARGKPYFFDIEPGLRLGYRKNLRSAATWVAARYLGEQKYRFQPLGDVNDVNDRPHAPNGSLSFDEAKAAALRWAKGEALAPACSITVGEAIEAYGKIRKDREVARAGGIFRIKDSFGSHAKRLAGTKLAGIQVEKLVKNDLRDWRDGLKASSLAIASVNRICKDIKAALNHAIRTHDLSLDSKILTDGLRGATNEVTENNRPTQVLTQGEVNAIVDAARQLDAELGWSGDLYRLVLVLAATGTRFSQARRLKVGDIDVEGLRIHVPVSHKGDGRKARTHVEVPVAAGVVEALRPALNGRASDAWLLERPVLAKDGAVIGRGPWLDSDDLDRPGRWGAILGKAGLRDLMPYCLRHSSIVRWLTKRFPVEVVAQLHDTGPDQIRRHYARYINDAVKDALAAAAEMPGGGEVVRLRVA